MKEHKLTYNQELVLEFLKKREAAVTWWSPTELGSIVFGLTYNSSKASAICKALVKKGLVKRHPKGKYKVA